MTLFSKITQGHLDFDPARPGGFGHGLGRHSRRLAAGQLVELGGDARQQQPYALAHNGRPAGDRLQAAAITAAAPRTVGHDNVVPELARRSQRAKVQPKAALMFVPPKSTLANTSSVMPGSRSINRRSLARRSYQPSEAAVQWPIGRVGTGQRLVYPLRARG